MESLKNIGYALLIIAVLVWFAAVLFGMIQVFPFGLLGLIIFLGFGLLFIKVLAERLTSAEDNYYDKNVEK